MGCVHDDRGHVHARSDSAARYRSDSAATTGSARVTSTTRQRSPVGEDRPKVVDSLAQLVDECVGRVVPVAMREGTDHEPVLLLHRVEEPDEGVEGLGQRQSRRRVWPVGAVSITTRS